MEAIGIDESGKGDFFGPLVVAAAYVGKSEEKIVAELGVTDSKKITDKKISFIARELKRHVPHEISILEPETYNTTYKKTPNLNLLLAKMHYETAAKLLEKVDCYTVIADQFGNKILLEKEFMQIKNIKLIQMHRAESTPSVAAASIFARNTFCEYMVGMDKKFSFHFPKGATHVVDAAKEFAKIYGREKLNQVSKAHFKTMGKI